MIGRNTRVQEWHLTAGQAYGDLQHRRSCEDKLCDNVAHHYGKAIEEGRVFVGGEPFKTWLATEEGRKSRARLLAVLIGFFKLPGRRSPR